MIPNPCFMSKDSEANRRGAGHTTTEPVRWLSVAEAVRTRGIGRSMLYQLIQTGDVKSSAIRKPGNTRGKRLVSAESLDAFIEAHSN